MALLHTTPSLYLSPQGRSEAQPIPRTPSAASTRHRRRPLVVPTAGGAEAGKQAATAFLCELTKRGVRHAGRAGGSSRSARRGNDESERGGVVAVSGNLCRKSERKRQPLPHEKQREKTATVAGKSARKSPAEAAGRREVRDTKPHGKHGQTRAAPESLLVFLAVFDPILQVSS